MDNARDPYALPPAEILRELAAKQDARAKEIKERRVREKRATDPNAQETAAADLIQRNYRGHRERNALQGYSLDPGTRWIEVWSINYGTSER